MNPEEEIAKKYAGEAGQSFQSVTQPETASPDRAKSVNQTLATTQFLSQETYFNPDRINEYGRRDAGPGEIELYDPDTRMAVARIAREPKQATPRPLFWQSNHYNPDLEYDSVDKGSYVSLVDPTTGREVARMVSPTGGSESASATPIIAGEAVEGAKWSPYFWQREGFDKKMEYNEIKKDGYISLVDPTTGLEMAKMASFTGGSDGATNEGNQNTEVSNLPSNALIRKTEAFMRRLRLTTDPAEIERLNNEYEPYLNEHNSRLQQLADDDYIDPIEELIELRGKAKQGDDSANERIDFLDRTIKESFTEQADDPKLKGLLEHYYTTQLAAELSKAIAPGSGISPTPPSTTPPVGVPIITTPVDIPGASSAEAMPSKIETFAQLQSRIDPILRIQNRVGALTTEQRTLLTQLQEKQAALLEKYRTDPEAQTLISTAKSAINVYIEDEITHMVRTGGIPIDDPEYLLEMNSTMQSYLSKYPELEGYLKQYYLDQLKTQKDLNQEAINARHAVIEEEKRLAQLEKDSVQRNQFERVSYPYDEQLIGGELKDPTGYIETQIEDYEQSGNDTVLKKIHERIEQIKAGSTQLKEKFNVELLNSLKYYIEARMQLHDAQKQVRPEAAALTEKQLEAWGAQVEDLLLERGAYYLTPLIKGVKSSENGLVQPLPLFNAAEAALWSETISEMGEVELADKTKINVLQTFNYFQFPKFTGDGTTRLTNYFQMKTLLVHKLWQEIDGSTPPDPSNLEARNQIIREKVRSEIKLGYNGSPLYKRLFTQYFNIPSSGDYRLATPKDVESELTPEDKIKYEQAIASLRVAERLYRVMHVGTVLRGPLFKSARDEADPEHHNYAARLATKTLRGPVPEVLNDEKWQKMLTDDPRLSKREIDSKQVTINGKRDVVHFLKGRVDLLFDSMLSLDTSKVGTDLMKGRTPQHITRLFFEPVDRVQSNFGAATLLRKIPLRRQDFFSMIADAAELPPNTTITSFDEVLQYLPAVKNPLSLTGWVGSIKDSAKSREFFGATPQTGLLNRLFSRTDWQAVLNDGKEYLAKYHSNESRTTKDAAGRKYLTSMTAKVNKLIEDALQGYNFGAINDKTMNLVWLEKTLYQFLQTEECKQILEDEGGQGYSFSKGSHGLWAFRYAFYNNPAIAPTTPEGLAYIGQIKSELEKSRPRHMKRDTDPYAKQKEEAVKQAKEGTSDIVKGLSGLFRR